MSDVMLHTPRHPQHALNSCSITKAIAHGNGEMLPDRRDIAFTAHLGYRLAPVASLLGLPPEVALEYANTIYLAEEATQSIRGAVGANWTMTPQVGLNVDFLFGSVRNNGKAPPPPAEATQHSTAALRLGVFAIL